MKPIYNQVLAYENLPAFNTQNYVTKDLSVWDFINIVPPQGLETAFIPPTMHKQTGRVLEWLEE
jgi:hypothetical protein